MTVGVDTSNANYFVRSIASLPWYDRRTESTGGSSTQ